MPAVESIERHCIKCGRKGPFRSEGALQCERCDEHTKEDRRDYHRDYHKARGLAMSRLIDAHQREYDRLLTVARTEIEEEKAKGRRKRAG